MTDLPVGSGIDEQLRTLALVDRIIGLEAQLAEASAFATPSRDAYDALLAENAGLHQQVALLQSTRTWRTGRAVLAPARAISRLRRR